MKGSGDPQFYKEKNHAFQYLSGSVPRGEVREGKGDVTGEDLPLEGQDQQAQS